MNIKEEVLERGEKLSLSLRELYYGYGYEAYRMSKFEEYDLYANNKEFLVSDNVITFTDMRGKLMALKPDVTLSIIKNSKYSPEEKRKVYYSEKVYRISEDAESYKEITQTGLECFGNIDDKDITEVILLAAKSLKTVAKDCVLDVSDVSLLSEAVSSLGLSSQKEAEIIKAAGEKNAEAIKSVAEESGADKAKTDLLIELTSIGGKIKEVLPRLIKLAKGEGLPSLKDFIATLKNLSGTEEAEIIRVDFSVIGDLNYYNGVVLRGFIKGVPSAVLSGGQYDNLMKKLGKNSKAIGFAVYVDALERLSEAAKKEDDGYLNIALPKGRLGEKVYSVFEKAGYECPSVLNPNRKLILENKEKKLRYFWVKPSDVTIYVERGAADIGVAGKDTILEYEPDVYELLDLKKGKCKMAVAAPNGFKDDKTETLRVATKFSNVAKKFYRARGRNIDVIHLNGSIEIAPILKLSDVIVDIVETGATLRENDLSVIETLFDISARLIANKSSAKFKEEAISALTDKISSLISEE